MSTLDKIVLSRRQALALGLGTAATAFLAGCSDDSASAPAAGSGEEVVLEDEQEAPQVDAAAYDALIATGAVAADDVIAASPWASKIKDAGTMRIGGTRTSTFFSLENIEDGGLRGFDAGLYQLLTRYVLGDESKYELTQVTSDTRESVLTNDQVDAVFATYSITAERQEIIDFAGPYYTSQQSILVKKDNTDITGLDDLAGKQVAVQSGSTGPSIMEEYCPEAILQEFSTDPEARQALEQGRVDAYVIDNTLHMGGADDRPHMEIIGEPFGPIDPYGIGLSKDSEGAVDFVNAFLQQAEDAGQWAELWQLCIGARTGQTEAPEPPAIGVTE